MSAAAVGKPLERLLRLDSGTDPVSTIAALWQGPGDPQMRIDGHTLIRAMRMASGPASIHLETSRTTVLARAWGPGADEALDAVPALVGEHDDPSPLVARHSLVADLMHRFAGLRLTSGNGVLDSLVPAILSQKVTGLEAQRSYRQLLIRHGEPAPGPLDLRLPPPPETLARMAYWAFHPLGVERRRADTVRAAAAVAPALERIRGLAGEDARRRLMAVPGIGPWTAAETARLALGDPDAISVGDYNLPGLVGWALAGERDADDARMLELLEPYRGQRARVVLLLERGGRWPERRGPRLSPRSIAAI
jgi:3-methyladenine DNA glycosylase/8-oxoguanine DNA glycosylase